MPGIGGGFIRRSSIAGLIDEIIAVSDDDAVARARGLARDEGILAGVSSGAALHAAIDLASRGDNEGKTIVVLLADTGERYVTTRLFSH